MGFDISQSSAITVDPVSSYSLSFLSIVKEKNCLAVLGNISQAKPPVTEIRELFDLSALPPSRLKIIIIRIIRSLGTKKDDLAVFTHTKRPASTSAWLAGE